MYDDQSWQYIPFSLHRSCIVLIQFRYILIAVHCAELLLWDPQITKQSHNAAFWLGYSLDFPNTMYSCTILFLYTLIPGNSSTHLTTDFSYSCLSFIRFLSCATTISCQIQVFFCIFPPLSFTPGPTAICLLRLMKYCKYCRVAPVVVAVEESILWNNHPDRKGLAGVRKGLGHWTFSRAVETPVPTSKSIHPSKGRVALPNRMNFREKNPNSLQPTSPPHFRKS